MDWLQVMGGAACKAMKLVLHMLMPSATYAVAVDSRRAIDDPSQAPPGSSRMDRIGRKERARLDAFFSANAQRPLRECKVEVLAIIDSCIESGHHAVKDSTDKTGT